MEAKSRADRYTYRVVWSEEDGEFVATSLEFGPALSWLDSSPEDALRGVRRVVAESLADMAESGEDAPEPLAEKTFSGKFMVRVPPELHRRLAIEAAEAGISLNRLVTHWLSRPTRRPGPKQRRRS